MAGFAQAKVYQCPNHIDINSNKGINQEQGWDLVTGEDAIGNGQYTGGPISAILTSGESVYNMLYPDEEDTEDAPHATSIFYTVEPSKYPVWVMCSYPDVAAVYFKKIEGDFKICTEYFVQHPGVMICE